jgi:hypothetical protein
MHCTAFVGTRRITSGMLFEVAEHTKKVIDRGGNEPVLIFDDETGETIEVDFRGTTADVLNRLVVASSAGATAGASTKLDADGPRGPGRPKLGVVAREVTLLPRHWDWLNSQPGGASVALRKLVEEARRANQGKDRVRRSQESAYGFMSVIAGNEPGFEEAARALFAGNGERFDESVHSWPADVRDHARKLAEAALCSTPLTTSSPRASHGGDAIRTS